MAKAKDAGGGKKEDMAGSRKAAVLMIALDAELAAKVMGELPVDEIQEISQEIARLETVEKDTRDGVLREFYNLNVAQQFIDEGGMEYAKTLIRKSMTPEDAKAAIDLLEASVRPAPFKFLEKTESDNLLTFIQEEHPQTVALILSYLSPEQGANILSGLDDKRKQIEVVTRLAKMDQTSPEVINQVEDALKQRLQDVVSMEYSKAGGVESAAKILTSVEQKIERNIMETLEEEDPELAAEIQKLMFVFEDLLRVNDKGIQSLLREISNDELAYALKTASEELKEHIFKNMSQRASEMIKEDMEYMGPVRITEVEAAQRNIIDVVKKLEQAGEIIVSGRGGEEEIVG
ncbi:MAG: flagellar motor switch protein FliG [Planctomycetes bacterium]|nr:flagellar motor switch protein FliG [Planctomycetota bacterium]